LATGISAWYGIIIIIIIIIIIKKKKKPIFASIDFLCKILTHVAVGNPLD
jgi:hypothetical protein